MHKAPSKQYVCQNMALPQGLPAHNRGVNATLDNASEKIY
jgi:hypothetical protein